MNEPPWLDLVHCQSPVGFHRRSKFSSAETHSEFCHCSWSLSFHSARPKSSGTNCRSSRNLNGPPSLLTIISNQTKWHYGDSLSFSPYFTSEMDYLPVVSQRAAFHFTQVTVSCWMFHTVNPAFYNVSTGLHISTFAVSEILDKTHSIYICIYSRGWQPKDKSIILPDICRSHLSLITAVH